MSARYLFITYSGIRLVRKVAPDGTISTVAARRFGGIDAARPGYQWAF
jgi:hypothetical protein